MASTALADWSRRRNTILARPSNHTNNDVNIIQFVVIDNERRQWDPGIPKHSKNGSSVSLVQAPSPSGHLVWDPGIASCGTVGLYQANDANDPGRATPTIDRPPVPLHVFRRRRRQWNPGIGGIDGWWPLLPTPCLRCMAPLVNHESLFQCSHPILSRPTVPNIR